MSATGQTYRLSKRGIDVVGAAVGLAVTCPVWLSAAMAIRLTMGRPVVFVQPRPGLKGKVFDLYKFRTMRPAARGQDPLKSDAARNLIWVSAGHLPDVFSTPRRFRFLGCWVNMVSY